jgi:hypothetical protein
MGGYQVGVLVLVCRSVGAVKGRANAPSRVQLRPIRRRTRIEVKAPICGFVLMMIGLRTDPAASQRVTGIVRDSATAQPVVGAVVTALDTGGLPLARSATGSAGDFTIGPLRGASTLRVIRIGFRPATIVVPESAANVNIQLTALPFSLETVRVRGDELCPKRADRAHAVQLWAQARPALLSAGTSESSNAKVHYMAYSRESTIRGGEVTRQKVELRERVGFRTIVASESPETLATQGYIRERDTGPLAALRRQYYLPDAFTLADETFVATHCLEVVRSASRPDEVGVAFSPLPGRDIPDIAGVIWIDLVRQELRSVTFRYTKLEPALMTADAGGELYFTTLSSEVTFIERWIVTLPQPSLRSGSSYRVCSVGGKNSCAGGIGSTIQRAPTIRNTGRREEQGGLSVASLLELGGAVTSVQWSDGFAWNAALSGVTGTIVRADNRTRAAFAFIIPAAESDTVVADASGRFGISPLPSGRYRMAFADTAEGRCAIVEKVLDVDVGSVQTAQVEIPKRRNFPWRSCKLKR